MRSGTKNCVVDIYQISDSGADPVDNSPTHVGAVWKSNVFASFTPRRGREVVVDGQIEAETWVKFEFDYFDVIGITDTMYIELEGVKYDVRAILPDLSTKEYIVIDATHTPAGTERA